MKEFSICFQSDSDYVVFNLTTPHRVANFCDKQPVLGSCKVLNRRYCHELSNWWIYTTPKYTRLGGSMWRYPSRWVERSLCRLCRKRRKKMNRYSDEQVHLWTCRTVEPSTGISQRLIGMKVKHEQVGSWMGTSMGMYTSSCGDR